MAGGHQSVTEGQKNKADLQITDLKLALNAELKAAELKAELKAAAEVPASDATTERAESVAVKAGLEAELSSLKVANTNLQLQLKADQSAMAALGESVEGLQLEMQQKESKNLEQIEELNQKLIMADVSFKAADEKSSKLEVCIDCFARYVTLLDSH